MLNTQVGSRAIALGIKKSFVLLCIITPLVVLLTGCEKPVERKAEAPKPIVEITQAIERDVPIEMEWIGTLDGMVNAQILAQVSGYLLKQNYQEGRPIKKGQVLYEIDDRVLQTQLSGAKSNLARQEAILKLSRLDLDRVVRLLPEKAVSVRDRDNAVGRNASSEAEVIAAKAAVEKAQLDIGFTKITSPIDGIAGISKTQVGNLVGPGSSNSVLTTISQLDPIKAYIPLSEQQYLQFAARRMENGDAQEKSTDIQLVLADGSVYPQPGKFFFADRQVDVKTGTIQIAILFPNPKNILRPGQYARVRAVVALKKNAVLVPQRAVTEMQGRYLVAVVKEDNTVSMRTVKTGVRKDSLWIIEEGVKVGENVIVEGVQKVAEGAKVQINPNSTPVKPTGENHG